MKQIRLLNANEIDCRISQIRGSGANPGLQLLLYKNARCDMAILDETFGMMNWQRHHTRDNANCIVSIWDEEKHQWIDKEDTGTESNTEAEKGLASDSFKRACVNVGIGRELYTAPFIWVSAANCEIKEKNGKPVCYDPFSVDEIEYNEQREIVRLVIVNSKTRNVVYQFGKPSGGSEGARKPAARKGKGVEKAAEKPLVDSQAATDEQKAYIRTNANDADYEEIMTKYGAELENLSANDAAEAIAMIDLHNTETDSRKPVSCERCGKAITGIVLPDKSLMSASELIGKSKLTYGGVYCYECMKDLKAKKAG